MQTVMIFGTFDHLHPGHHFVFTQALQRGNVFAVVAQDATVQRIKGKLPEWNFAKRTEAITTAFNEVTVIPGSTDGQFLAPITQVQPDLLLFGYDQRLPPGITEADLGVPMERLPAFEPEKWKSSKLRTKR